MRYKNSLTRLAQGIAAALCAVALGACDSPRDTLQPHDMEQARSGIASMASEGGLLARQLGEGSVTVAFVQVHAQALRERSLDLARDLARPALPPLRARQQALAELNNLLTSTFSRVALAGGEQAGLQTMQQTFAGIHERAARQAQTEPAP